MRTLIYPSQVNPSMTPANRLKIAFTYDRRSDWLALGFAPNQCLEFESDEAIEGIAQALRSRGDVEMISGLKALTKHLVAHEQPGWDIVFNICEGYGSVGREAQVPALLEAWGVPFTFSDPATLALCQDKAKTKMVLEHYGVATAPFACIPPRNTWPTSPDFSPLSFINASRHHHTLQKFPLFVKPASSSTGLGISQANKVTNQKDLESFIDEISKKDPSVSILVESFLSGREFTVGIVGTASDARVIGIRELVYLKDNPDCPIDPSISYDTLDPEILNTEVYGHEMKRQWCRSPQFVHISLDNEEVKAISDVALRAWRVLGCRDGGRVDVRNDVKGADGVPNFMEVNPIAGLAPGWSDLPQLAKVNGIGFDDLISLVLDSALKRAGGSPVQM